MNGAEAQNNKASHANTPPLNSQGSSVDVEMPAQWNASGEKARSRLVIPLTALPRRQVLHQLGHYVTSHVANCTTRHCTASTSQLSTCSPPSQHFSLVTWPRFAEMRDVKSSAWHQSCCGTLRTTDQHFNICHSRSFSNACMPTASCHTATP